MGHRHPFSTSQIFESENDPNWNHMNTEHPFGHLGMMSCTPFSILLVFYFFYFFICNMQNVYLIYNL